MPSFRLQGSNDAHGRIFIALGANRAYRRATPVENLNSALAALDAAEVTVTATSRAWRSPAWPDPSDPPFINGCAALRTRLGAENLMDRLHEIEKAFGRTRSVRNAPRSMDLDLIDYRGVVRTSERDNALILPHPRAVQRAFVLLPLKDIAPDWREPGTGRDLDTLIARLPRTDREACQPVGDLLCAAANGLKRPPE